MTDPDTPLALTQASVQSYFEANLESLLSSHAGQLDWEEWLASVRFSSEETWLRCNAFLLAHTMARYLACSTPTGGHAARDPWLQAFVASVALGDTGAERLLWLSAPVADPIADDGVRYSAVLWSMCLALRTSRLIDGARPGPYPHSVWFEEDDTGHVLDADDELV